MSSSRRLSRWHGWAFALTIVGYPVAGLLAVLLDAPSWALSFPFRAFVVVLSLWLWWRTARSDTQVRLQGLLVLFWALYVARLAWDTAMGPPGALDALWFMVITTLIPTVALVRGAAFWNEAQAARALLAVGATVCLGGVLFGLGILTTDRTLGGNSGQLFLDTVNPISFSHAAVTTLITGLALVYARKPSVPLPLVLVACTLAVACMMLAAARGPVVALGVCVLVMAVMNRRWGLIAAAGIALVAAVLYAGETEFVTRFQSLEDFEGDRSALERLVLQANALQMFAGSPWLGAAYAEFGLNTYPHNLYIETAMALGVVGLLLVVLLTLRAIVGSRSLLQRGQVLLPLLLIQYFVGFQFSGALWGSSAFWACLALVLCQRARRPHRSRPPAPTAVQPA